MRSRAVPAIGFPTDTLTLSFFSGVEGRTICQDMRPSCFLLFLHANIHPRTVWRPAVQLAQVNMSHVLVKVVVVFAMHWDQECRVLVNSFAAFGVCNLVPPWAVLRFGGFGVDFRVWQGYMLIQSLLPSRTKRKLKLYGQKSAEWAKELWQEVLPNQQLPEFLLSDSCWDCNKKIIGRPAVRTNALQFPGSWILRLP